MWARSETFKPLRHPPSHEQDSTVCTNYSYPPSHKYGTRQKACLQGTRPSRDRISFPMLVGGRASCQPEPRNVGEGSCFVRELVDKPGGKLATASAKPYNLRCGRGHDLQIHVPQTWLDTRDLLCVLSKLLSQLRWVGALYNTCNPEQK